MKQTQLILLLYVFSTLIGCKKDFPVTNENEKSVFSFKGIVNGSYVSIDAGDNNYYMYADYKRDSISNWLFTFIGDLRKTSSANNSLKIEIVDDSTTYFNGPSNIYTSIVPANYTIQDSGGTNGVSFSVPFIALADTSLTAPSYVWDFGDGNTSTFGPNIVHTYNHPGTYTTCLTITYSNGCSSNICNQVKVGDPTPFYITAVSSTEDSLGNIVFSVNYTGNAQSYLWDFGDGTTDTSISPNHSYNIPGIYKVCLQITDVNGTVTNFCATTRTYNYNLNCISNFAYLAPSTSSNYFAFSTAIISWTDNMGVLYSSKYTTQSNDNYFKIVSVEDYKINEKGEPTKKLHVKFKCKLSTASGSSSIITINNGDAVIAVSYK